MIRNDICNYHVTTHFGQGKKALAYKPEKGMNHTADWSSTKIKEKDMQIEAGFLSFPNQFWAS